MLGHGGGEGGIKLLITFRQKLEDPHLPFPFCKQMAQIHLLKEDLFSFEKDDIYHQYLLAHVTIVLTAFI